MQRLIPSRLWGQKSEVKVTPGHAPSGGPGAGPARPSGSRGARGARASAHAGRSIAPAQVPGEAALPATLVPSGPPGPAFHWALAGLVEHSCAEGGVRD